MGLGLLLLLLALEPKGEIVAVKGRFITLRYDFEDAAELGDFEPAEPPKLERAPSGSARVEKGRLVLEGVAAVRHRLPSNGPLRARMLVRLDAKGDGGALIEGAAQPLVLDLADRRFYRDGGFLLSWLEGYSRSGAPNVRDVARAPREAIELQLPPEADADVGLHMDGGAARVRVGSLYREGAADIPAPMSLVLWCSGGQLSVDSVEITVEMDDPPRPPRPLEMEKEEKLLKAIKDAPLSPGAIGAARELSRRDAKAWEKLASLARNLAAKQPYAALPLVRAIAEGSEPERRALLADLSKRVKAPEVSCRPAARRHSSSCHP